MYNLAGLYCVVQLIFNFCIVILLGFEKQEVIVCEGEEARVCGGYLNSTAVKYERNLLRTAILLSTADGTAIGKNRLYDADMHDHDVSL